MTIPPGLVLAPGGVRAMGASTAEVPVGWRLPTPVPRSASDGNVGSNNSNGTTDTPIVIPDTPVSSLVQHADTQQTPSTPRQSKENTDTHQQTPSKQCHRTQPTHLYKKTTSTQQHTTSTHTHQQTIQTQQHI